MQINKYQGLILLKDFGLPTIEFDTFARNTVLSDEYRWTLRVAKKFGGDFGLPIFLNKSAKETMCIGYEYLERNLNSENVLLVYPFFNSAKTGTMALDISQTIVEATRDNCANLTRYNKLDISIIYNEKRNIIYGDVSFFDEKEIQTIERYANVLRKKFFNILLDNVFIILEWSFATYQKTVESEQHFLFQELRII